VRAKGSYLPLALAGLEDLARVDHRARRRLAGLKCARRTDAFAAVRERARTQRGQRRRAGGRGVRTVGLATSSRQCRGGSRKGSCGGKEGGVEESSRTGLVACPTEETGTRVVDWGALSAPVGGGPLLLAGFCPSVGAFGLCSVVWVPGVRWCAPPREPGIPKIAGGRSPAPATEWYQLYSTGTYETGKKTHVNNVLQTSSQDAVTRTLSSTTLATLQAVCTGFATGPADEPVHVQQPLPVWLPPRQPEPCRRDAEKRRLVR
jgi:hypothetical protein